MTPAGWFPDPYGRAQKRHWDGNAWTVWVSNGNDSFQDPLGTTTTVPFTAPIAAATAAPTIAATPTTTATTASVESKQPGFLESLGPDARERPLPSLRGSFGAVGGLLVAAAVVLVIFGDSGNRGLGVLAAVVLIAASTLVMLRTQRADLDLRSGAVAMVAVGIGTLTVAITATDPGEQTYILAGALFLVAWFVPPFRGRPFLLGAGVFTVVFGLGTTIGSNDSVDPMSSLDDFGGLTGLFGQARSTGLFFLAAALLLAFLAHRADRAGFRGISAPLLVSTILSAVTGVIYFGIAFDNEGVYLLAAVVGLVLAFVGARGGHRATTWFGTALAGIGGLAVAVTAIDASDVRVVGLVVLVVGVALALAPRLARSARPMKE